MTRPGEKLRLEFEEDGFMTVNILSASGAGTADFHVGMAGEVDVDLQDYEQDPFADSDLPVYLDNEDKK